MWGSMARLKFGSPAWRKKYMKKAKAKGAHLRKRPKRRNSSYSRGLKAKKARLREMIREAESSRKNPKMKRLTKSTGWMKANAVKIVKKGGQMQVLVRKPGRKR